MKRLLALVLAGGIGVAATALAQGDADPYSVPEPAVTAGQLLRLPGSAGGCDATRSVTVRVTPPPGAVLGHVRVAVDNREAARLTGVPRAASARGRVPLSGGRVTASAETLGGQRVRVSRVYADCTRPPEDTGQSPTGGGEG